MFMRRLTQRGELKHGTIALITENVPVIALATQPAVYEKMVSNIREVKARGAYVILISMGDEVTDTQICDKHIRIPKQDSLFTVFAAVIFAVDRILYIRCKRAGCR